MAILRIFVANSGLSWHTLFCTLSKQYVHFFLKKLYISLFFTNGNEPPAIMYFWQLHGFHNYIVLVSHSSDIMQIQRLRIFVITQIQQLQSFNIMQIWLKCVRKKFWTSKLSSWWCSNTGLHIEEVVVCIFVQFDILSYDAVHFAGEKSKKVKLQTCF